MARFEVEFYPGEDNERLPEWTVVEIESEQNGVRCGQVVWRSCNMQTGQQDAEIIAEDLNRDWAIAVEEASEFDQV